MPHNRYSLHSPHNWGIWHLPVTLHYHFSLVYRYKSHDQKHARIIGSIRFIVQPLQPDNTGHNPHSPYHIHNRYHRGNQYTRTTVRFFLPIVLTNTNTLIVIGLPVTYSAAILRAVRR